MLAISGSNVARKAIQKEEKKSDFFFARCSEMYHIVFADKLRTKRLRADGLKIRLRKCKTHFCVV
jgi:hypothetical protein